MMIQNKLVEVKGSKMHYREAGEGQPILFLHGVPTSSYIWRNIIPHLSNLGTCIAPDLIGFGESDKPNIRYTINEHIAYIEAFIDALDLTNITLVMHGWGSVIGFDYAMRHEKNCNGLVFYEAFMRSPGEHELSLPYQEQLISLQSNENAFDLAKNGMNFIDHIIPQSVLRTLNVDELAAYRQPFTTPGSGKPIQQYLKELPDGGSQEGADQLIENYTKLLTQSSLPKLMMYSVPGFITTLDTAMWAKQSLPNLEIVDLGEELHLAQESCPELMAESISIWLQALEQAHA